MKKLLIAIMALTTLASCATMKPTQRVTLTSFSDYREYAKDGFLISPSPYTYDFESVGELNIIITPAKVITEKPSLYSNTTIKGLDYEKIEYEEMVEMAVKEAKSKGADALVNFTITKEYVRDTQGLVKEKYYNITGFCIKRK